MRRIRNTGNWGFYLILPAFLILLFAPRIDAQIRNRKSRGAVSKEGAKRIPLETLEFLRSLPERTGRIEIPDDLSGENVRLLAVIEGNRSAYSVFRVPLESEGNAVGKQLVSGWKSKGSTLIPLINEDESEDGEFHLIKVVRKGLETPSVYLIQPASREDIEQYMEKSEGGATEQDKGDLEAIDDMLDNDALDHMYMDQAGIPGSPNDSGNNDDDDGDGEPTDEDTGDNGDGGGNQGGDSGGSNNGSSS